MVLTANSKKDKATSEFATLVCSNEPAVGKAVSDQEFVDNINWGLFAVGKEDPDITGRLVDNKEVRGVAIVGVDHPIASLGIAPCHCR